MTLKKIQLIFLVLFSCSSIYGQIQGSEILVSAQIYKGTFVVGGDMNTYYPVIFKYANQDKINNLKIYRSYSEGGPNALSPTHKGGLTLDIDVNYGGWGGSTYDWRLMDLRQTYHETFAGASHIMYWMGFVVWLRGGGFVYHYESNDPANLQVAYSESEIIFNYWGNPAYSQYTQYAPLPKIGPDNENISSHRNDSWAKNATGLSFLGNVGIGTTNPEAKLTVKGKIIASEIQVKDVGTIPDYVFKPGYQLMTLNDVDDFVAQNQHLPDVPSEKEFKENGMNMAEMNALLLKKIEELTLYLIKQKKDDDTLRLQIQSNQKVINRLLQFIPNGKY